MDREFTLEEARALIPHVRQLLEGARADLGELARLLKEANERLLEVEWELRQARLKAGPAASFASDARWKHAADRLARLKTDLRARTQTWLVDIGDTGSLLRDLNHGLVDFPGRLGEREIYWCWHLGEETVSHWHSRNEGFASRQSVSNIPAHG